eukprot:GHVU01084463.1.p3 GENE.GHVU01084463.1~~GHVU01084463.1.p3  ORF type:complete len:110 (-),score=9.65 GHVU01084463.1:1135-1431(-)
MVPPDDDEAAEADADWTEASFRCRQQPVEREEMSIYIYIHIPTHIRIYIVVVGGPLRTSTHVPLRESRGTCEAAIRTAETNASLPSASLENECQRVNE